MKYTKLHTNKLVRFSLFIFLYLYLFGPNLKVIDFMYVAVFLSFLSYFVLRIKLYSLDSKLIYVTISTFPILFYSLFLLIIGDESQFVIEISKFIIFIISTFGVVNLYVFFCKDDWKTELIQDIVIASLVVAFTTIIIFMIPSVKEIVLDIVNFKMADNIQVIKGIRGIDISVGGGTALSIVFFLGVVLSKTLYFWNYRNSYLNSISFYIFAIAALITARTGFLLIIFILLISWCITLFGKTFNIKVSTKVLRKHFYLNSVIFLLFSIFVVLHFNELLFDILLPWALEMFINASDNGFSSESTNDLISNHYNVAISEMTYLFGGGSFFIQSDVGLIKVLSSVGILGALLLGLPLTLLPFYVLSSRVLYQKLSFEYMLCFSVFFVWFIIFLVNFKELFFSNSRGAFLLFLLISVVSFTPLRRKCSVHNFI